VCIEPWFSQFFFWEKEFLKTLRSKAPGSLIDVPEITGTGDGLGLKFLS
jgi:hypothetical protein